MRNRPLLILALSTLTAVIGFRVLSQPPTPVTPATITATKNQQVAIFAGGCFWGVEAVFEHLNGVSEVVSGYSGGDALTAQYEVVSSGMTGHAEAVKILYDPTKISYNQLLKVFFEVAHNPTELNRQGPDKGPQYRSAVFFTNAEQKKLTQAYITQLNKNQRFPAPIVTQVTPLKAFYAAESYHQDFITRNPNYPYVVVHDLPKLAALQKQFPTWYKKQASG